MRLITDWHIHSKYSRACSKDLTLPNIAKWCEKKGIDVVGTSDFTHPAWFKMIEEELEETADGMFAVRGLESKTRFMLTSEVACIYKRGGKVRRLHHILVAPNVAAVAKIRQALIDRDCNLNADGRPILGLDSQDLLKILLEADERCMLIPAHAWTPWFSVFGSKSGFDSLEECFGDLTKHIYAIETGLSSDPTMNWRLSQLDNIFLISNSDAHSLRNLGREANVFDIDTPTYGAFRDIFAQHDTKKFLYTIEFFPEEGKYHFDGHAACKVSLDPRETKKHGGLCPSCKKPLLLGVAHRVEDLADRTEGEKPAGAVSYKSIVPLETIISQAYGVKSATKKVLEEYERLISGLGSEFSILLDTPLEEIARAAKESRVVEAIRRVREGRMILRPGYDGVYGEVDIFSQEELQPVRQGRLI